MKETGMPMTELKIQTAHSDDEMWVYSKGHHEDAQFIAAAKKHGCQKDDDEAEGYQLEKVQRTYMRKVPAQGEWASMMHPVDPSTPGAFPITMAICYWVNPPRAASAAKGA